MTNSSEKYPADDPEAVVAAARRRLSLVAHFTNALAFAPGVPALSEDEWHSLSELLCDVRDDLQRVEVALSAGGTR